ncbi:MAG TPA: hypothetical protein VNH83_06315 [Bryobacteraceae bacterium]|nr:hypothetical protein [Bryobacteraceae bacterium]
MDIASARTGGNTAAAIDVLNAKIAALTTAITNNAVISSGNIVITDPALGAQRVEIAPLSISDSASVMENMKTVLQARLDALTTALAGLI